MQYADRQRSARSLEWRCWEQWQGAQQIFARSSPTSWVQHGQISTLGLPGTPLATEHFATIGGHVGSEVGLSPIAKMSSSPNPDLKMLLYSLQSGGRTYVSSRCVLLILSDFLYTHRLRRRPWRPSPCSPPSCMYVNTVRLTAAVPRNSIASFSACGQPHLILFSSSSGSRGHCS